jgi:hypothetical protein
MQRDTPLRSARAAALGGTSMHLDVSGGMTLPTPKTSPCISSARLFRHSTFPADCDGVLVEGGKRLTLDSPHDTQATRLAKGEYRFAARVHSRLARSSR